MITFICDILTRYVLCFNESTLHLTIKLSRHLLFHCMFYEPQLGCLMSVFFLCRSFFRTYIFPFLPVGVGVVPVRAQNVPYHLG